MTARLCKSSGHRQGKGLKSWLSWGRAALAQRDCQQSSPDEQQPLLGLIPAHKSSPVGDPASAHSKTGQMRNEAPETAAAGAAALLLRWKAVYDHLLKEINLDTIRLLWPTLTRSSTESIIDEGSGVCLPGGET